MMKQVFKVTIVVGGAEPITEEELTYYLINDLDLQEDESVKVEEVK